MTDFADTITGQALMESLMRFQGNDVDHNAINVVAEDLGVDEREVLELLKAVRKTFAQTRSIWPAPKADVALGLTCFSAGVRAERIRRRHHGEHPNEVIL